MTDEHQARCPACNRLLGHEPGCPLATAEEQPSGGGLDIERATEGEPFVQRAVENWRQAAADAERGGPEGILARAEQERRDAELPTAEDVRGILKPVSMFAISEAALDRITDWINCDIGQTENYDEVIALIRAARESGPIPDSDNAAFERALAHNLTLAGELSQTRAQRDFLLAQIGSLILRLSGAYVAAGLIDLNGASVYAAREQAVINSGLAQIGKS